MVTNNSYLDIYENHTTVIHGKFFNVSPIQILNQTQPTEKIIKLLLLQKIKTKIHTTHNQHPITSRKITDSIDINNKAINYN